MGHVRSIVVEVLQRRVDAVLQLGCEPLQMPARHRRQLQPQGQPYHHVRAEATKHGEHRPSLVALLLGQELHDHALHIHQLVELGQCHGHLGRRGRGGGAHGWGASLRVPLQGVTLPFPYTTHWEGAVGV